MATREEIAFLRWTTEVDKGCHDDMHCLCDPVLMDKMAKAKAEMGPLFESFLEYLCNSCKIELPPVVTPPTVQTGGQGGGGGGGGTTINPPVIEPPVIEPPERLDCYEYPSPSTYETGLDEGADVQEEASDV